MLLQGRCVFKAINKSYGAVHLLDNKVNAPQLARLMCWWLLGRHHPYVIGEYDMVENAFPQSRSCPLWVDFRPPLTHHLA